MPTSTAEDKQKFQDCTVVSHTQFSTARLLRCRVPDTFKADRTLLPSFGLGVRDTKLCSLYKLWLICKKERNHQHDLKPLTAKAKRGIPCNVQCMCTFGVYSSSSSSPSPLTWSLSSSSPSIILPFPFCTTVRGGLCLFGFGFFVDLGDFFSLEGLICTLCVYCKLGL